jgi:hypothetical protein
MAKATKKKAARKLTPKAAQGGLTTAHQSSGPSSESRSEQIVATFPRAAFGFATVTSQGRRHLRLMHYLKAIEAIGSDEAPKVMEQMRATPVNDFFAKNGKIRIDGRMVHDRYLFEVKKPEESKGEWDLYKLIATIPGDEAFRPLDKGGCPLVKTN